MRATVTKYEDMEVDISEEQVELLMLHLLKEDYQGMQELDELPVELMEAMKIVYEAYAGKPIDLVERFIH